MESLRDSTMQSLMRRAAARDPAAQAELLERYRDRLRRMVALRLDKRLAPRVDASDIVQETLNKAYGRLDEYFANPQFSFYPWLRRMAWDRLVDMYRQHVEAEKRSVLKERPWLPLVHDDSMGEYAESIVSTSANPSRRLMLDEMRARLHSALNRLKAADREVLVLRHLEQLSVEETAAVLGISQSLVTTRHLRAVRRLRKLLGEDVRD